MSRSQYAQFAQTHAGAFALGHNQNRSQGQISMQPVSYGFPSANLKTLPFPSDSSVSGSDTKAAFRAPAHKHAHHLHSIPPREKSTRTLIIDHMLWVHARTRFAQARAELGMTDRTGGPPSLNHAHRERPENYEEDEEELSDGEGVAVLYAREGGSHEDARLRKQDLSLARGLRLRAEGLEKVVTSMLDQPPAIHPMTDEDILPPPTPPSPRDRAHPHTLPNGVRLRLALCTTVNDLFARQAAHPPFRQQVHASPAASAPVAPTMFYSTLPDALLPLAAISAASPRPAAEEAAPTAGYAPRTSFPPPPPPPPPAPSARALALYAAGAEPGTGTPRAPAAPRCPRHLYAGCAICVEAKAAPPPVGGTGRPTSSGGGTRYGLEGRAGPHGGAISGWQDGSGIGSGLARPAVGGSALRRTPPQLGGERGDGGATGNTKLSALIPRFMRLSALVAAELGREAREDEISLPEPAWGGDEPRASRDEHARGASPLSAPSTATSTRNGMWYTLQPSREWYMLLAGLLTRAVLEGYLTAGWRGPQAAQCLLTVGLGVVDSEDKASDSRARSDDNDSEELEDGFEEFDPDEMPSLKDAARMLFPALQAGASQRKDGAEAEYGIEMDARLRKFFDISASTPDLSAHLEHLAWQYHAEPVERAAARFCESLAKWRGKPELETYKRKPPRPSQSNDTETPGGTTMTIDSLVHSSPISTGNVASSDEANARRPPIEKYFTLPSVARETGWNRSKRGRSADEGQARAGKKVPGYSKPLGNL